MITKPGEIDVFRARALRRDGLTWLRIAAVLTEESGRAPKFHSQSVYAAVTKAFGTAKVAP